MNWLVVILVTVIIFSVGMTEVYVFFDPASTIANIVGGLVGIVSASVGLIAGEEY